MYKTIRLLACLLSVVLVSCGQQQVYKIGVSQCAGGPWREKVNLQMLVAQHLYEHDVEVSIACSYDDTELQIRQIDSLVNSGIDLLVVAPSESKPIADVIKRVHQKGIPVIFFDRKATTNDYTAFIGGDNVEAGQMVANYALEVLNRGDVPLNNGSRPLVLEITGAMSTSPAQERHQGFSRVMEQHGDIDYLCLNSDWTPKTTYDLMLRQIKSGRLPDIVFCHNDGMANDVYKAMKKTQTTRNIRVIGIDGLSHEGMKYVQQGQQIGSYVYPTHGEKIVRLALDILTNHPYDRHNELKGMMVTPDNCNMLILNSEEQMQLGHDLLTIQNKLEESLGNYQAQRKVIIVGLMAILLLILAITLALRAYQQMRRTLRQRQAMNEEQTLFYTNPDSRTVRQVFEKPDTELPTPRSQDTIFAETLNKAIMENMSNPNLKMEDLGEQVGLSRVQLYRKVKSITGLSPVELLRQMRLQQGYVLLATTNKTVQEIAFEVGFGTPGYFSKCFRQQYGKYPMELRNVQN